MNFKTAIKFAKKNYLSLLNEQKKIIGVSYNPNDKFERFEIYDISLNIDDLQDEGIVFFDIGCNGMPEWGGISYNEIIKEIPESAKNLNYQVFKIDDFNMIETYHVLKMLFPELPNPETTEFISDKDFEQKASEIINKINESDSPNIRQISEHLS